MAKASGTAVSSSDNAATAASGTSVEAASLSGGTGVSGRRPWVLEHFDISYVGICLPHIWIWSVNHRGGIDYGGLNIGVVLYIMLSLTMCAVIYAVQMRPFKQFARGFEVGCAAVQTVATLGLTLSLPWSGYSWALGCAILGGMGIAVLYLEWAHFYAELSIKNSITCIFLAMALGSFIKIPIDLLPEIPAGLMIACLPALSLYCSGRARRKTVPRDNPPRIFSESTPTSIPWEILLGVAVYSCIIGIIQGTEIQAAFTPLVLLTGLHHGMEIIIALVLLWLVLFKEDAVHVSSLWRTMIFFSATGVFFLPWIGEQYSGFALTLVGVAQTLVVMLFWVMLADIAEHSRVSPYVVFGAGWIAYTLPLAIGSFAGSALSIYTDETHIFVVLTYVLTMAAVFSLNESNFSQRRIFVDLDIPVPEPARFKSIDEACDELKQEYRLTGREAEILKLICKGRSKTYIAESLYISDNTVRSHTKHIYTKLDVHSKQEILDILQTKLT